MNRHLKNDTVFHLAIHGRERFMVERSTQPYCVLQWFCSDNISENHLWLSYLTWQQAPSMLLSSTVSALWRMLWKVSKQIFWRAHQVGCFRKIIKHFESHLQYLLITSPVSDLLWASTHYRKLMASVYMCVQRDNSRYLWVNWYLLTVWLSSFVHIEKAL